MIARRVGEPGFVNYLHELLRIWVLSQGEVLSWMRLHGDVIRWTQPPLDDGSGPDEEALQDLERGLGEV